MGWAGLAESLSLTLLPDVLPALQPQADRWRQQQLTLRAINCHIWLRIGYCGQKDEGEGHRIYFLLLVNMAFSA